VYDKARLTRPAFFSRHREQAGETHLIDKRWEDSPPCPVVNFLNIT
jgi:hypothetical protein